MFVKAKEIASKCDGIITGDPEARVSGVSEPETAGAQDLVFLFDASRLEAVEGRSFAVAVTVEQLRDRVKADAVITVSDPRVAMARVLTLFHKPHLPAVGIHPEAYIEDDVLLGRDVRVGAYSYIGTQTAIGDNTVIYPNCYIGRNVKIGEDCVIMPGVYIHDNTVMGHRVILGPGAVIGHDGFGFAMSDEHGIVKIPQVGRVIIGDDVEVGANACIDRSTVGETVIQDRVKIDNLVQIAHNVVIGHDTIVAAQTGIAGSSQVGTGVIFAGQVGVADHLKIGDRAVLTAKSGVSSNVPEDVVYSSGVPARDRMAFIKAMTLFYRLPELFERLKKLERDAQEDAEGHG